MSLVPSWVFVLMCWACSPPLRQVSCCRLALFLESFVTTARAAGAASCLLCRRMFGSRSWLWADLWMCCSFILLLGSALGARREGRAVKRQPRQQPPDLVANHHSVMKMEALDLFSSSAKFRPHFVYSPKSWFLPVRKEVTSFRGGGEEHVSCGWASVG